MEVKNFVDDTIKSKPVVVFSKTYCPFCVKVKKLFQDQLAISSDKLTIIELENRPDCSEIQAYLKELTGASSVSISRQNKNLFPYFNQQGELSISF